jgi:tetratricopeptide (TPR) repeat protein
MNRSINRSVDRCWKNQLPVPESWVGWILFAFFLVLYGAMISGVPVPGASSQLVAKQLGLDPFASPVTPIWGMLVQGVAAVLPAGGLMPVLHFVSALCAAASVGLLYGVMVRLPHFQIVTQENRPPPKWPGQLAGLVAALAFGFCVPLWLSAVQAHPAPLQVVLFLAATYLLVRYIEGRDPRWLERMALVYGVGVVESNLLVIMAPFYGVVIVVVLALSDQLSWRRLGRLALLVVPGLLLYLVGAFRFMFLDAYELFGYQHVFEVVWVMWRDQYTAIRHGLGRTGWLLVLLTTAIPALFVVSTPRLLHSYRYRSIGPLLLHVMLTVFAGLLLFNAPLSPWALAGSAQTILFPYLLWALTIGYVAAFWHVVFSGRYMTREWSRFWRRVRPVWWGVLALSLLAAAVLNAGQTRPRGGRVVQAYMGAVLDQLGEREWLVSNGVMDEALLLAARQRQQSLRLINVRLARNPVYLRFLAGQFEDERLQSLASLGVVPLLNEWIAGDEAVGEKLAALSWDQLWAGNNFYPVPEGVLFGGARQRDAIQVAPLQAMYDGLWAATNTWLAVPAAEPETALDEMARMARHQVSRISNNYGVLLEELGQPAAALEAYLAARAMHPDNVSALLNAASVAEQVEAAELEGLRTAVEALQDLPAAELRHWSLVARYGIVRHPEAYARRGLAWAMSGKADVAIADLQRAIEAGAEEESLGQMLASLYFASEQFAESERLFLRMLREQPDQPNALMGLAQIATRRGEYDLARGYLERLRALGVEPQRVALEDAILDVLSGEEQRALATLRALVKEQPGLTMAWATLVVLGLSQQDEALVDEALAALGEVGRMDVRSLMIVATAQLSRNQLEEARVTLDRVIRLRPTYLPAYEQLLRLDVAQADKEAARRRVETILSIDARNALGNYILGSLHYDEGKLSLAESAYRASIRYGETAEACNDLAWVLQAQGALGEALRFSRRALELNANNAIFWSTLGTILRRGGEWERARVAFERGLELRPEYPVLQLNLAEAEAELGEVAQARERLAPVLDQLSVLDEDHQRRALQLAASLRE